MSSNSQIDRCAVNWATKQLGDKPENTPSQFKSVEIAYISKTLEKCSKVIISCSCCPVDQNLSPIQLAVAKSSVAQLVYRPVTGDLIDHVAHGVTELRTCQPVHDI